MSFFVELYLIGFYDFYELTLEEEKTPQLLLLDIILYNYKLSKAQK